MTRDARELANQICGCSTEAQMRRDIALIEADRTASEQRGYDRAIAEVVAWLREQHDGRLVSRIYLASAIEAGEHKP